MQPHTHHCFGPLVMFAFGFEPLVQFSTVDSCSYHLHTLLKGSRCEGIEEQMRILEEESKSGKMTPSRYEKLLRARRKRDEYLSKALIKKVSKPCASCGVAIEKNEG